MSRMSAGDTIVQKPTNNIYTVLAAIGFIVVVIALVLIFLKSRDLFPPDGLF
jgi:uncharacterized membrane protein (DUF373 family)